MSAPHRTPLETAGGTKMVQTYKIAVLGDGGVGKSGKYSLLLLLFYKAFLLLVKIYIMTPIVIIIFIIL